MHRNRLACFSVYWCNGKFSLKFFICVSNAPGSLNEGVKSGRCACPDVAGIQFELEEQARLLELLLGVAHTAKTAYSAR